MPIDDMSWLLSVDYAELEKRVLGHDNCALLAMDHATRASVMFGVEPDKVTPEQYRLAKAWAYQTAYGGGD